VTKRRLLQLLAVLFAFSLVAAACGDSDSDDSSGDGDSEQQADDGNQTAAEATTTEAPEAPVATEPAAPDVEEGATGGTLIWAHEQEPPDLHLNDPNNNLTVTAWLLQPMLEDLYGISAAVTFYPELLAEEAELVDNGDGTITANYTLRGGLSWSDGEPLTANDVLFTWETIMEEGEPDEEGNPTMVLSYADRTGYDTIIDFTVNSDTEFSITWSAFFAGWKGLFTNVLPSHALPGGAAEAEEALRDWTNAAGDTLPSSGPLVFENWEREVAVTYSVNANYHGSMSPDARNDGLPFVDEVVARFVPDTDAQINALKAEEAHLITAQPQTAFGEEVATDDTFQVATAPGPIFEHWGLNLLNPHLTDPLVREALAYALDKGAVMEFLYTPIFGSALPASGLGNTYWMTNQPQYENHQQEYDGAQTDAAAAKLAEAGYTLNGDGIYEHPERGALTLRVGTTGGNALRELQQQIIQAQLKDAGIDIVIDNVPGAAYFGEKPFSGEALAASSSAGAEGDPTIWDITQFAWVGGPWPGSQSGAYKHTSGFMPYGFVSEDFVTRSDECDATVDDTTRDACYELNRWVTTLEIDAEDGLFMLPLTQKPTFYAYNKVLLLGAGASPDVNHGGPLANVVDFQLAG